MGNCSVFHDELRFDVRDPEFTHVYVFLRAEGDCPFMINGWHHKAFPSSVSSFDVLTLLGDGTEQPMHWEREAPKAMNEAPIFNPLNCVPVPAEHLQTWHEAFAHGDGSMGTEYADQITAHLTSHPKWHEACPFCRAHEAFNKSLRDQQE